MKKTLIFIIVLVIIATVAWGILLHTPIIKKNDFHYVLKSGVSARTFANDLHKHAGLKNPFLFRLLIKLSGEGHKLQSGEYFFPKGSTASEVLGMVVDGEVLNYPFIIVNGWNYRGVVKALQKNSSLKKTIAGQSAQAVAKKLGTEYKTPEGLLFPDTYYYVSGATDFAVLQRAYKTMQDYLQKAWQNRASDLPYRNSYKALIVASMIEKETAIKQEKPIIAAVILNRLKKWIPLQIDATVIYGLGENFNGDLTRKDLRHKTPYNTYVNYGLPPTPISMPGRDSIQAALHPAKTDVLYFVAKDDGTHKFSKTLKRHDLAVEKYQLHESVAKQNK